MVINWLTVTLGRLDHGDTILWRDLFFHTCAYLYTGRGGLGRIRLSMPEKPKKPGISLGIFAQKTGTGAHSVIHHEQSGPNGTARNRAGTISAASPDA